MSLAVRVIPCLDVAAGRVVKGLKFENLRDAGDPVEAARRYEAEGADELCFLDVAASHEGRGTLVDLVRRVADVLSIPFTVGGGVRSVEDAGTLLEAGAARPRGVPRAARGPRRASSPSPSPSSPSPPASVPSRPSATRPSP